MKDFVIFVDSACDIPPETLKEWGVRFCSLSLVFSDDPKEYSDYDIPAKEFYGKMRNGVQAKTSHVNMGKICEIFEGIVSEGKDILYLCFSSGLSATYNFASEAAAEVMQKHEGSTIKVIDSLCASAGYGLLLYLMVQKKNDGAYMDELADFAENNKLKVCHWFTVDDLKYLKAGGRISATTALLGGMLNIKPVMKMDNNGKLVSVSKVRGRKAALKAIAQKYGETAIDPKNGTVFICHADCDDDAKELAEYVKEDYGAEVKLTVDIGPVIGSHSGPGTLALFFLADER